MENPPQDQVTNPKTHNTSEIYSTSPLEELLVLLTGLGDLMDLEVQEVHQPYPLDTSSLFNQPETSNKWG